MSGPEYESLLPTAPGAFPVDDDFHAPLTFKTSLKNAWDSSPLNWLLVFLPLGIAAGLLHWSDTNIFVLNFLALIPLAKLLGTATEEISLRTSQTIGGLMNATFGNLVEMVRIS
jgi:Ca2+:H+ antiporter